VLVIKTMDEVATEASKETLCRLVSGHQGLYKSPVVLVEWDQAPGCIWPIRVPECMGTARQGYGEYQRYYLWERPHKNSLKFEHAPITDPRFDGTCGTVVSVDGDQMSFTLSVTNGGDQVWPQFFMHVCLQHMFTRNAHQDSFAGNHFVFGQEGWQHVQTITPEFPELEFAWCCLEGHEGFTDQLQDRDNYLRPYTATRQCLESERVHHDKLQKVAIQSPDAAALGWSGWPCTDMALNFGDVEPGETRTVGGVVGFSSSDEARR
jgi:hypothetical protein